jgi:cytochrome c biogenesis protein CcmG, thiol:disulfide interchange protein DsbE
MRRVLSPVSLAAIGAVVALLALLGYGLSANEPEREIDQAVARGERVEAPKLQLPKLFGDGESSLDGYRGKVVVLNFWASWCEPCRAESPLLQRWHEKIADSGGTVLGVDVLDVSSDAREFARKYKLSYPMVRDRDADALGDFGVVAYPETFVIDRRGRIAATRRGPVDERFLRREVTPLLRERV